MCMTHDELVIDQTDEPTFLAWLAGRHPGFQTLVLDRIEDGVTVVEAAFEPLPALPTLLNTGGKGTEIDRSLSRTVPPGRRCGSGVA